MRRRLAVCAATIATAGAALAFAQDDPVPAPPAAWSTRPEVPGAARTLVPFGVETTSAGPRAWALGRAGDATLVLQRSPGGGWSATRLATGRPAGGEAPQHAGELTADGHGAVLLAQPTQLFTRAPGAAFTAAPDPGAALAADEQLVGGDAATATARTLLAVIGGDSPATFVAPTTADGTGRAVLRLDADGWHREPVDAPEPVRPVALAAAGPARAWMLATAGDRVVLLRRDPTDPRWVLVSFDDELQAAVSKVEVAPPPADPLTATSDGVWIDLRVTPPGATAPIDLTERLKVTEAPAPDPTATPTATATADRHRDGHGDGDGHRHGERDPDAPPPHRWSLTAAGATGTRCAITRWASSSPAAAAATARWPRPRRRRRSSAPARSARPSIVASLRASAPATPSAKAGTPPWTVRRSHCAKASARTAARRRRRSPSRPTARASPAGRSRSARCAARSPARPRLADPLPLRDALVAGATSPTGDGRVFALGRSSGAMLYAPGSGWSRAISPLLEIGLPPLALVWPRPNVLIAGGSAGLLATADADPFSVTFGFDDRELPPMRVTNFRDLKVENTIIAIACTPSDPLDCVAGGLDGLIVRGDGRNWRILALPATAPTHITGVAFDGRTPLLATTDGLYVGEASGDAYVRDDDLRARMTAAGLPAAVRTVATVADGGIAVDGRFVRDSAATPWRPTAAPLDLHPYALAAYRDPDGAVRSIVSATSEATPLPEPFDPEDDDGGPPDEEAEEQGPPLYAPSPADAVVLRESADGWIDLDRSRFQWSGGRDLPDMTPNTRAILVDADGSGVLLGGVSDPSTRPSYSDGPDAATLAGVASARRLERGAPAPAPSPGATSQGGETPASPGSVRLAVGGHPACLDRCGGAGGQGYAPDTHLQAAIARVRAMVAGGAGPAALLIGGGRASLGGEPLDPGGARRYRELTQGAGVPTYVLPGPGDVPDGGAEAFASAFATAAAPQGTGEAPAGVDLLTVTQPDAAVPGQARSTFAFDVKAPAGTVRVIAIDNAAGRLAGGPDGAQAQWLRATMEQARLAGFPSVVVGSTPLDDSQNAKPAEDAEEEIALLAGHASAYVATAGVDDPADRFFGGVLARNVVQAPGAVAPLTLLQSATLGYAPSQRFTNGSEDEEGTRQTDAALLMIDVAVAGFDPTSGVAPVDVVSEPLLQGLAIDEGSRAVPLGWALPLFVSADALSPRRFLMSPGPNEPLRPASPRTVSAPMVDQCRFFLDTCTTVVPSAMAFTSANPRIARFVAVRAGGRETDGVPQVVLDASGHVIDDPRGFICPLAVGTVDITLTALGQRVTTPVRVIPVPRIDGLRATAIPAGTCAFPNLDFTRDEPKPAATPQPPAATTPPAADPAPAPADPQPQPQPAKPQPQAPAPAPVPATPIPGAPGPLLPPASAVPSTPSTADAARPPVAPAPKPPVAPAPPTPPQGLQVQSVEAPQVQPMQAVQYAEQRREEYAYESDSAAVAYARPPSPLPWEIAGGVATLALVMAGGGLAGRSRSRAAALAKASAGG